MKVQQDTTNMPKGTGKKKNLIRAAALVSALLSVFAVCANEMLYTGNADDTPFVNLTYKLSQAFSTFNIIDVLALLLVYKMVSFVLEKTERADIYGIICGLLFSFSYVFSFSYKNFNSAEVLFADGFQTGLSVFMLTGFFILFYFAFEYICILVQNIKHCGEYHKEQRRLVFILTFVMVTVGWGAWILYNYPGSVAGDAVGQLGQFFSGKIGTHHPPLSTAIMGLCIKVGKIIYDSSFGIALYLLLQTVIAALIISYSMVVLYEIGAPLKALFIFSVYFSFMPLFGLYAQYFEKDMLFGLMVLLVSAVVLRRIHLKDISWKSSAALVLSGAAVMLLRNNGIHILLPFLLAVILYEKDRKIRLNNMMCLLTMLVLFFGINTGLYTALDFEKGSIREALSIPMQQSARYIREYSDELTEEEQKVLDTFFSGDYMAAAQVYEPTCADHVKNIVAPDFPEPVQYFRTWFLMGLKHPSVYIDAFINVNYGYIAPTEQNAEPNIFTTKEVISQLDDMGIDAAQNAGHYKALANIAFMNVSFPLLRYLTMPGLYSWMLLILLLLSVRAGARLSLVMLVPYLFDFLVCLASPLCNGLRYELPVVMSIHLLVLVVIIDAGQGMRKRIST